MTYLVDASVLSEPTKPVPNNKVIDWLTANEGNDSRHESLTASASWQGKWKIFRLLRYGS